MRVVAGVGLRPRRSLTASVVVLLACVAAGIWLTGRGSDVPDESDVRYLERELVRLGSVPAIQAWLLQHPEGPLRDAILADVTEWPACFRALRALRVLEAENGGVKLQLARGLSLTVYPRGKRPAWDAQRATASRGAHRRTFGEDASIAETDR